MHPNALSMYSLLLWYQFWRQIIFKREEESLVCSLLNIICRQIWYQSKSGYMDRASGYKKLSTQGMAKFCPRSCWMPPNEKEMIKSKKKLVYFLICFGCSATTFSVNNWKGNVALIAFFLPLAKNSAVSVAFKEYKYFKNLE